MHFRLLNNVLRLILQCSVLVNFSILYVAGLKNGVHKRRTSVPTGLFKYTVFNRYLNVHSGILNSVHSRFLNSVLGMYVYSPIECMFGFLDILHSRISDLYTYLTSEQCK